MKTFKAILIILLFVGTSSAQNGSKIGYVDADYLLSNMPELKEVEKELSIFDGDLRNQLQAKYAEFQKKVEDYKNNGPSMSFPERHREELAISDTQSRILKFEQEAQVSLQKKQTDLMEPLQYKIKTAIKEVALGEGIDIVLPAEVGGMEVVLYASNSSDLTDKVFSWLGITPPPRN